MLGKTLPERLVSCFAGSETVSGVRLALEPSRGPCHNFPIATNFLLEEIWMAPPWLSTLASIGMALGPPLVYVDQTTSIIKKKYALLPAPRIHGSHESTVQRFYGVFSRHLCSSVRRFYLFCCLLTNWLTRLLANITRCFFWLGERFEFALLLQSLLMILCQVSSPCTSLRKAELS
jgi:hypothetical protein